jgi:hypothetical protein
VSIDLRVEKPILLRVFGKHLKEPRDYDTVRKWWKHGLLADRGQPKGKRVRLETVRLTGGRHTTIQAYERFIASLNCVGEEA